MALGTLKNLIASPFKGHQLVAPSSLTAAWVTAIDAGGMDDQDAASITNPTTQITLSTRHIIKRSNVGTVLLLRLAYDAGLTVSADPVVKVFGRIGPDTSEAWQLLLNKNGDLTGTLTTASTDVTDGTYDYTTPSYTLQGWDCLGCDELIVGVQTVLAGVGTVSNAFLQAKII